MDNFDKYVIKTALETLRAAGGTGLRKRTLLDQIDLAAGEPMGDERHEEAFAFLEKRGWITWHVEPVWHNKRYTLTDRGLAALEAM